MISDLPSADDFYTSGKELLNISWGIVISLLIDLDDAQYYDELDEDTPESYWYASKRHLSTALSIMQQGIEFILKGKIAEISPYLLIVDSPSKWPSPNARGELSFLDFRTIDAQDLIRVIDVFSEHSLSPQFITQFDLLRKKRNRIMHSVDANLTINATEIVESLLFMHKTLFPDEKWAKTRLHMLNRAPESELGADEYSVNRVCREVSLTINLLKPAKVKDFFGIEKKQRSYICPGCYENANTDSGFDFKVAVLNPKGVESNKLYCPVCNDIYTINRISCEQGDCRGNVQSVDGICLTCGF